MNLENQVQEVNIKNKWVIPKMFREPEGFSNYFSGRSRGIFDIIFGRISMEFVCGKCGNYNLQTGKKENYPSFHCNNCEYVNVIPITYGLER